MKNRIAVKRNYYADVIRGIAILMVVLGHTITGCYAEYANSLLFNVIWTLQIPLFFIISGYVTKFSHEINTAKELGAFIKKRTLAYMLPWIIWTFFIRGIILGQSRLLNIKELLYNMDIGYWFLFSLWVITMIFGISQWMSKKVCKSFHKNSEIKSVIFTIIFYIICVLPLVGLAIIFGLSFLCLKLTLYYIPFYLAGYLYGKIQNKVYCAKYGSNIVEVIVAIASIIYFVLIVKVDFFTLPDNMFGIPLRATASLLGCVAIVGIVSKLIQDGKIWRFFSYIGIHSLEIYLVHCLILSSLSIKVTSNTASELILVLVAVNFLIAVSLSILLTWFISGNKWLNFVLFAKSEKKK